MGLRGCYPFLPEHNGLFLGADRLGDSPGHKTPCASPPQAQAAPYVRILTYTHTHIPTIDFRNKLEKVEEDLLFNKDKVFEEVEQMDHDFTSEPGTLCNGRSRSAGKLNRVGTIPSQLELCVEAHVSRSRFSFAGTVPRSIATREPQDSSRAIPAEIPDSLTRTGGQSS